MALEICILTAARSGEVLNARWSEFDLRGAIWTVPAARMKASREHRVPRHQSDGAARELMRRKPAILFFLVPRPTSPSPRDVHDDDDETAQAAIYSSRLPLNLSRLGC